MSVAIFTSYWWHRYRWALIFGALAVSMGLIIGIFAAVAVGLPAPKGNRSTYYVELLLAGIGAVVLLAFLISRARTGLPILLAVLAFLPSRTGMQWQYRHDVIVSVADLVTVLGIIVVLLHTKILRKERLQPLVIGAPLAAWLVVGVLGIVVSIAQGLSWESIVAGLKGFYLWLLIIVLCVNLVRTRFILWAILLITIISAVPTVLLQLRDEISGGVGLQVMLANGAVVNRSSGDSGPLNQFAFYIMAMFFLALGLGMATKRWTIRLFFWGCAALFFVSVGLTYTRGAWIALVVGILVLAVFGGRKVFIGTIIVAAVVTYFIPTTIWDRLNFSDNSIAERVSYNETAFGVIRDYPLTGGGWGSNFVSNAGYVEPISTPGEMPIWHNDYLVVATQVGIPGLAVYLWIWASLLLALLRSLRQTNGALRIVLLVLLATLIAMSTQALTDRFVWRNETGPLMWLMVGLTCAVVNMVRQERQQAAAQRQSQPASALAEQVPA